MKEVRDYYVKEVYLRCIWERDKLVLDEAIKVTKAGLEISKGRTGNRNVSIRNYLV